MVPVGTFCAFTLIFRDLLLGVMQSAACMQDIDDTFNATVHPPFPETSIFSLSLGAFQRSAPLLMFNEPLYATAADADANECVTFLGTLPDIYKEQK